MNSYVSANFYTLKGVYTRIKIATKFVTPEGSVVDSTKYIYGINDQHDVQRFVLVPHYLRYRSEIFDMFFSHQEAANSSKSPYRTTIANS